MPVEATDPETLARRVRSYLRADRLIVDFASRSLSIGEETPIVLSNKKFALYALMAIARSRGWPGAGPEGVGDDHRGWIARRDYLDPDHPAAAALVALYTKAVWETMKAQKSDTEDPKKWEPLSQFVIALCEKMQAGAGSGSATPDPVTDSLSKINDDLAEKVPNDYVRPFLCPVRIRSGNRGAYRSGLEFPAEKIDLRNLPSDFAQEKSKIEYRIGPAQGSSDVFKRLMDGISRLPKALERR